jgi:hypothetical protein
MSKRGEVHSSHRPRWLSEGERVSGGYDPRWNDPRDRDEDPGEIQGLWIESVKAKWAIEKERL